MWDNHKKNGINTILIYIIKSSSTSRLGKSEILITGCFVIELFDVWQTQPKQYH